MISDQAALAAYERLRPERVLIPHDTGLSRSTYRAAWEWEEAGKVAAVAFRATGRGRFGGGQRGAICAWSPGSRARMLRTLGAVIWSGLGPLQFGTLTYHAPPDNGRAVKAQLKAFRKRYEARFGSCAGAWKMEFQRRGAVHFHLILAAPAGIEVREVRAFVAGAWHDVVTHPGSSCPGSARCPDYAHRRAGVQWDRSYAHDPARYFAKYGAASTKSYQNRPPEWYEGVGRFWGLWGVRPTWARLTIPAQDAVLAKRILRRYASAQRRASGRSNGAGYRPGRYGSRSRGMWVLQRGEIPGELGSAVRRAVGIWRMSDYSSAYVEAWSRFNGDRDLPGDGVPGVWRLWSWQQS